MLNNEFIKEYIKGKDLLQEKKSFFDDLVGCLELGFFEGSVPEEQLEDLVFQAFVVLEIEPSAYYRVTSLIENLYNLLSIPIAKTIMHFNNSVKRRKKS